jgi:hypothetical protein
MNTATTSYIRKLLAAQLAFLASQMDKSDTDHMKLATEIRAAGEALQDLLTPAPLAERAPSTAADLAFDVIHTNRRELLTLKEMALESGEATVQPGAKVLQNILNIAKPPRSDMQIIRDELAGGLGERIEKTAADLIQEEAARNRQAAQKRAHSPRVQEVPTRTN